MQASMMDEIDLMRTALAVLSSGGGSALAAWIVSGTWRWLGSGL
jgi:hypothetical protein